MEWKWPNSNARAQPPSDVGWMSGKGDLVPSVVWIMIGRPSMLATACTPFTPMGMRPFLKDWSQSCQTRSSKKAQWARLFNTIQKFANPGWKIGLMTPIWNFSVKQKVASRYEYGHLVPQFGGIWPYQYFLSFKGENSDFLRNFQWILCQFCFKNLNKIWIFDLFHMYLWVLEPTEFKQSSKLAKIILTYASIFCIRAPCAMPTCCGSLKYTAHSCQEPVIFVTFFKQRSMRTHIFWNIMRKTGC